MTTTNETTTTKTKSTKVEAYGIKGLKGTPWRRIFKNVDALNAWADKTDSVEVFGTRDVEE